MGKVRALPVSQQHSCTLLEQLVPKGEGINKGLSRLWQWNVMGGADRATGTRENPSALPKVTKHSHRLQLQLAATTLGTRSPTPKEIQQ